MRRRRIKSKRRRKRRMRGRRRNRLNCWKVQILGHANTTEQKTVGEREKERKERKRVGENERKKKKKAENQEVRRVTQWSKDEKRRE